MNYRYIYLVFSKTGTWLSKIISVFAETKYVHSSISFDNRFSEMYSFGRTNPNNPFSGGLVKENIYEGIYKKFPQSECLIYRVMVTEEQYFCINQEIQHFLKDKYKYKYNFLGLFGVIFNKPLKRKDYYFCTQFVSEILIKSKVYDSNKIPELSTPNDLLSIKNKELIYEGLANKYYKLTCPCSLILNSSSDF